MHGVREFIAARYGLGYYVLVFHTSCFERFASTLDECIDDLIVPARMNYTNSEVATYVRSDPLERR